MDIIDYARPIVCESGELRAHLQPAIHILMNFKNNPIHSKRYESFQPDVQKWNLDDKREKTGNSI